MAEIILYTMENKYKFTGTSLVRFEIGNKEIAYLPGEVHAIKDPNEYQAGLIDLGMLVPVGKEIDQQITTEIK